MSSISIAHVHLELPLQLSPEKISVLVVENGREFFEMASQLVKEFSGGEGNFIFSKNDKIVSPDKCGELFYGLFGADAVDRKTITLLYKKLEALYAEKCLRESGGALATDIAQIFAETFSELSFPVEYDDPQFADLLKACSVRPQVAFDTLLEKLICAINLCVDLKNAEFAAFIDLKSLLCDDDLERLYQHCQREKVSLFLLESCVRRERLPFEKTVVITEDLCEILA